MISVGLKFIAKDDHSMVTHPVTLPNLIVELMLTMLFCSHNISLYIFTSPVSWFVLMKVMSIIIIISAMVIIMTCYC